MADQRDDYEVGYGKPPKHSRWKKGQSGNPSGKRTREESLKAKRRRIADSEISVRRGSGEEVMTREMAMLMAVFMKATKGDMAAVRFVAELVGSGFDEQIMGVATTLAAADLAVLESHADWRKVVEDAQAEIRESEDPTAEDGDADPAY